MFLNIIVTLFVIAFIIQIIMNNFYGAKLKGKIGEKVINEKLERYGHVLSNYIIKDSNGKTHQIDTILVNKSGVFVIETKNYAGRIYGTDEQQNWTQVLNYGKVKNQFYNPVKQNATHCYFVKKLLPKNIEVHNIVVFVKNNTKYLNSCIAINRNQLGRYIDSFPILYNDEMVAKIIEILEEKKDNSITNEEHIANVIKTQCDIENNICPRCGANLVLRHGRNGDFYGCSNYPRCKFTKKK